jgi:alkanesulfonate monooxygenase SsuD/methylene tetrahydromethanopterin reductase-like flavin-dependent oxidoreductase (luciferase family)
MAATTLDLLSKNRTTLGLGASTAAIVENWHGLKFEKPLLRMREYIDCLRQMIKGDRVRYSGQYLKVKDFKLLHKPQREKIPLFVAAVNKNMISLASDMADGILLYLRPIEELRNTISQIKANTRNKSFEIACVLIGAVSNKQPEKARERAAKTLAFYTAVGKYYNSFLSDNGFGEEVEEITSEYWRNGPDEASKFVSEKMLDSLTISGNSDQCVKSLGRFVSAGVALPIIQVNPVGNPETSIKEMLATF